MQFFFASPLATTKQNFFKRKLFDFFTALIWGFIVKTYKMKKIQPKIIILARTLLYKET